MTLGDDIPARLDRLPWSRWHWRVVLALGAAWVLDGLEVTIVGSIGSVLERGDTLALTATEIGWAGSLYVGGAVMGALVFGRLADALGRKRLFLLTLLVYMAATVATSLSIGAVSFSVCRFLTGVGIGGEYAAINSAIDELIPARVRGRVNLAINGSFWLGAALGAVLSLLLLDPRLLGPVLGWRASFAIGVVFAIVILRVRRHVPESPRWLLSHGQRAAAEATVAAIEAEVGVDVGERVETKAEVGVGAGVGVGSEAGVTTGAEAATEAAIEAATEAGGKAGADVRPQVGRPPATVASPAHIEPGKPRLPTLAEVATTLLHRYRSRSAVVLAMMISQAFFYNAIFFTYALVLTRFYAVDASRVGLYILPFAVGNVLGPLLLGPLFDSVGRRRMIGITYALSGIGLALTGVGFVAGLFDATTQTIAWSVVFFFASAAASSAYLTVSEVFPLEMRALAIALFYAIGTAVGGFAAPALFGALIQTGSRMNVAAGYGVGSVLVIAAAAIAWRWGVDAEGKSLEEVAASMGAEWPVPASQPGAARSERSER